MIKEKSTVSGAYCGHPFTGIVKSVEFRPWASDMIHVALDEPIKTRGVWGPLVLHEIGVANEGNPNDATNIREEVAR